MTAKRFSPLADPQQVLRFLLMVAATLLGVFAVSVLSPATAAHAASTTSCEGAVCYATSTRYAVGTWEQDMERENTRRGTTPPSNPRQVTAYSPCLRWTMGRHGAGYSVWDYPADDSGTFTCWARGGQYDSTACPPLRDRASNGLMIVWRVDGNGSRFYSHSRCLYPTDSYAPIQRNTSSGKVYTGGKANFLQTGTSATAASRARTFGAAGIQTDTTGYLNRGVDLTNPERFIGQWQPEFNARTGKASNGNPLYGYYRVDWALDYRICQKWQYPSWLNEPTRYDCAQRGTDKTADPYTYSCDSTPPLRAGIHAGSFTPSACNRSWQCVADNDLLIGGLKDTLTVLRNGEAVTVTNPTPRVTQQGDQVRNARWEYRNSLIEGSTPFNPDAKVDGKDQWFYSSMKLDNKWQPYRAQDEVAFYWASDGNGGWKYQQQYAFTGNFRVPNQASLNGGTSYSYAVDRVVCSTTEISPTVIAVRSVNGP